MWRNLSKDAGNPRGVANVSNMQLKSGVHRIAALCDVRQDAVSRQTRFTNHPVHFVALGEKQLREVRAVLASNAGDERTTKTNLQTSTFAQGGGNSSLWLHKSCEGVVLVA